VALARYLTSKGHSVLLAAPYRSQAALLRRGVDDLGASVRAGTVHRLQGQEADVAVYDPTKPHQHWPDQSREAPLMLNVAASRGKRAFVLCNGLTWLRKSRLLQPFLRVAARVV
jgi:superfamily I DNA and/or RNA helicase